MAGVISGWPRTTSTRVAWEVRRMARRVTHRLGLPWFMALLGAASLSAALWLRESQHARWEQVSRSVAPWLSVPQARPATVEPDARARLRAFDDHLPEHDEIPAALQDLIALAQTNGLTLARGNYRPQLEAQGVYLRYRMTLPVMGQSDAVQRFMMAALREQPTLSLESVQFKRERIDTSVVEARIQWALLTRMPPDGPMRPVGAGGTK